MDLRIKIAIQMLTTCCALSASAKYFPMGLKKPGKKGFYVQVLANHLMRSKMLFTQKGVPTRPFNDLLRSLGIVHDGTIDSIAQVTNAAWLSCDAELPTVHEKKEKNILSFLHELGCVDKMMPSQDF